MINMKRRVVLFFKRTSHTQPGSHNWLMMLGSNPYPTRHSITSVDEESLSVESQLEE